MIAAVRRFPLGAFFLLACLILLLGVSAYVAWRRRRAEPSRDVAGEVSDGVLTAGPVAGGPHVR